MVNRYIKGSRISNAKYREILKYFLLACYKSSKSKRNNKNIPSNDK